MFYDADLTPLATSVGEERAVLLSICCAWV